MESTNISFEKMKVGSCHAEVKFYGRKAATRLDLAMLAHKNTLNFVEVKSSLYSEEKIETYLDDIAAQVAIIRYEYPKIKIGTVQLALLNGKAQGPNDKNLFIITSVKEKVEERVGEIDIDKVLETRERTFPAEICENCKSCINLLDCFQSVPESHSIFDIPRFNFKKIKDLFEEGIFSAKDVPDVYLTEKQKSIVDVWRQGSPSLDNDALDTFLEELGYDEVHHYLDFEAARPSVPWYSNHAPYTLLPFQYSVYSVYPNKSRENYNFLHEQEDDPSGYFTDSLIDYFSKDKLPIVVYSSFERSVLQDMIRRFPQKRKELEDIIERLRDLHKFIKESYVHPEANGRSSIKVMLPVLCKEDSYSDEQIQDGVEALNAWSILRKSEDVKKRTILSENLKSYCQKDAESMYYLLEAIVVERNRKI